MPPNGNAGARRKSNFWKGKGRAVYVSSQAMARALVAISVSASASFAREALTHIEIGRPFTTAERVAHGPAAKAIRYVLIGSDSWKRCVTSRARDVESMAS